MTGLITWENLSWLIGVLVAAGIAVSGVLLWVWRLVASIRNEADVKAAALEAKIAFTDARFNEYQIHVAERFATKDGVTQAIGRVEAAIEKLSSMVHDSVDRITNRVDRVLDRDRAD